MDFIENWSVFVGNVKRLLREKGWSIQEFADYADKDRASVSRIISGPQKDIKLSTLFLFAKVLGVEAGYLIETHDES